jgi:hypothetical protein
MNTYTINYKENEHDSGAAIEVEAEGDEQAMKKADEQVEQGFRNTAFASVEIQSGCYSTANRQGKAVGGITYY